MTTSKNSLMGISIRAVQLSHNYGISPDTLEMPPAMKLSHWSMDLTLYYQMWNEIVRRHDLEDSQGGLSVHWPPGQRLMRISPAERRHRYET